MARMNLKREEEAIASFERLLQLDPSNKKAQEHLRQLLARQEPAGERVLKKNRLHIVEVEGCDGRTGSGGKLPGKSSAEVKPATPTEPVFPVKQDSTDTPHTSVQTTPTPAQAMPTPAQAMPTPAQATPTPAQAMPTPTQATPAPAQDMPPPAQATPPPAQATPTQAPLPAGVQELKEDGNGLFRSGRYGEASVKYSGAISLLEQGTETVICVITFTHSHTQTHYRGQRQSLVVPGNATKQPCGVFSQDGRD